MQPGEIILYESASVIHGRPEEFKGDLFANIFVHYAPVDGWTITDADVQRAATNAARKMRSEKTTAMKKGGREKEGGGATES